MRTPFLQRTASLLPSSKRTPFGILPTHKLLPSISSPDPLSLFGSYSFSTQSQSANRAPYRRKGAPLKKPGPPRWTPIPALENPGLRVQGVTHEDILTNPKIAAFYAANFPPEDDEPYYEDYIEEEDPNFVMDDARKYNIREMSCFEREDRHRGTHASNWLRETQGLIPGIVYGRDDARGITGASKDSRLISTPFNQFQRERDLYCIYFKCRVYNLTTLTANLEDGGEIVDVQRVVPVELQMHPIVNKVYSCNFLRYYPGKPIPIPIVEINQEESLTMKRGGFIAPINRTIRCVVEEGVAIPEGLELDCTGLMNGDVVRADRLIFPEGVKVAEDVDVRTFLHGSVYGRRSNPKENKEVGGVEGAKEE
mmetsp:Transcript_19856/g.24330  ORF Transcript_19856/g.24330 Transcript_19856/m.24330 type:complete len:367 (-) Transcript_19856:253-1353(-)